jgi:RND family efflux transporter MFP subunit
MEKNENEITQPKKGKKKKVFVIILCVVLVFGFIAYRAIENAQAPEYIPEAQLVNVQVTTAEHMSLYSTAPISGRINPVEEVVITPLAAGEVIRVHVRMGDFVERGARLFDIDVSQQVTQLSTNVNQTREMMNSAQTSINSANTAIDLARTSVDRMQTLFNEGAVSLQALEQAQNALSQAETGLAQARSQYVSARESFNAASSALSGTRDNAAVTAPMSGYITSLNVSVGSMASPGVVAATLADVSSLVINTSVSEQIAFRLSTGDAVAIGISVLGDEMHPGIITAVSPAPALGGLTFPVTISVPNESGQIMAGMFAEINIVADQRYNVIAVPSDAVLIRGGRPLVVVLDAQNIPEFREVVVGLDNGIFAEIISGISAGETVVIAGQHFVDEGVEVNVVD